VSSMMHRRLRRQAGIQGMALPVVLVIASMMLVTSSAWFEASLLQARNASLIADDLLAFHAADAALLLCTRALMNGSMQMPAPPTQSGEPGGWRQQVTFDSQAVAPLATWPGSVKPPQCLFESWRLSSRPAARAFVITARGFGSSEGTQNWLQVHLVFEETRVERHWRRVVARPF
jgi:hypothetical protein